MCVGTLSTTTCARRVVWKIDGFKEKYLNSSNGIYSSDFKICDSWWYLRLCVEDNEDDDQRQIGIYLFQSKSAKNDILVNCIFTLRDSSSDSQDYLACRRLTHWFLKDSPEGWGFCNFVDMTAITHSDITVEVSITAAINPEDLPYFASDETVKKNLGFLRSGITPDVIFIVEEREFVAHREVLSVQSDVFQRILNTEKAEAKTGKIVVLDVKADIFDKFLDFLYTGAYPENFNVLAEDLFALAHKYEVDSLKQLCIAHFEKMDLDHKSAVALLLLSDKYPILRIFKKRIVDYLKGNLDFLDSTEWEELKTKTPGVAIELLTFCIKRDAKK